MHRGSFTIEASIYIPLILFLFMNVLTIGIDFYHTSRTREENVALKELDIVLEFYNYQVLKELEEGVRND